MASVVLGAVIGVVIGMMLLPLSKEEAKSPLTADAGDVLSGLMACLVGNVCHGERSVEVVHGQKMLGVYHRMPERRMNIKYIFQSAAKAMTVVVIKDNKNQLSIYDTDFDGVVDIVTETMDGNIVTFSPSDPAHVDDYRASQFLYEFALQTAWDKVIPEKMRKHLEQNPDMEKFRS